MTWRLFDNLKTKFLSLSCDENSIYSDVGTYVILGILYIIYITYIYIVPTP